MAAATLPDVSLQRGYILRTGHYQSKYFFLWQKASAPMALFRNSLLTDCFRAEILIQKMTLIQNKRYSPIERSDGNERRVLLSTLYNT